MAYNTACNIKTTAQLCVQVWKPKGQSWHQRMLVRMCENISIHCNAEFVPIDFQNCKQVDNGAAIVKRILEAKRFTWCSGGAASRCKQTQ
jgi:hypothetical protein